MAGAGAEGSRSPSPFPSHSSSPTHPTNPYPPLRLQSCVHPVPLCQPSLQPHHPHTRRYGFNPGSALVADVRSSALIAGRAAVTTTLSGAAGGLTCLLLGFFRHVAWDLISLCNGMLVGFVAVTAGCHVIEPW